MPDEMTVIERVCPYLRGRSASHPALTPGPDNYCLLASSIHLPRAQQTRYCLGGHFEQCHRYQLQGDRPLPRYVRGARPMNVRASAPTVKLRTLPWRHPRAPRALKWLIILSLTALFIALWQWRMTNIHPYVVKRDSVPTPVVTPAPEIPIRYLRPTEGPPEW